VCHRAAIPARREHLTGQHPPVTSRTLLTNRRSVPPWVYSFFFSWNTTKSMAPAMSMWVASTGSRSVAWMA
jgi:hypothetical protein